MTLSMLPVIQLKLALPPTWAAHYTVGDYPLLPHLHLGTEATRARIE